MNEAELRRLFPNASASTIRANQAGGKRVGPHPGNQEQHVQHRAERKPRVEKAVRKTFRVAVTLRFADLRTRDPDAALSTLLDCIIAARRQLEGDTGNHRQSQKVQPGDEGASIEIVSLT